MVPQSKILAYRYRNSNHNWRETEKKGTKGVNRKAEKIEQNDNKSIPNNNYFKYKWAKILQSKDRVAEWASLVAQMVMRLPAMWETWVQSPCRENPLEEEVATHSSTLAWKIPWMEEPGRLQSMGLQRVRHDWAASLALAEWIKKQDPPVCCLQETHFRYKHLDWSEEMKKKGTLWK